MKPNAFADSNAYADCHINLGLALLQEGRLDEAIPEYQKAVDIKRDYAGGHYNLGYAYLRKGEVNAAIAEFLVDCWNALKQPPAAAPILVDRRRESRNDVARITTRLAHR